MTVRKVASGGVWRVLSGAARTDAPPSPPFVTDANVVVASLQATVFWNAPLTSGGKPITSYTVTATPETGSPATTSVGPGLRQATVTGLIDGQLYAFTVTATNLVGTSSPSAPASALVQEMTVAHGIDLDATKCGVQRYLDAGLTLSTVSNIVHKTPGTYVYDGHDITGKIECVGVGTHVIVRRSRQLNAVDSNGTRIGQPVKATQGGKVTLEDFTQTGATINANSGNVDYLRCDISRCSDGPSLSTSGQSMVETWVHDLQRTGPGAHSDCLQTSRIDGPAGVIDGVSILRSRIDAFGDDDYQGPDDPHNAALQLGNFTARDGTGQWTLSNYTVTDSYLDGGNHTVAGGADLPGITYSGNRFGRNFRNGPFSGDLSMLDATNVWASSGPTKFDGSGPAVVEGEPVSA